MSATPRGRPLVALLVAALGALIGAPPTANATEPWDPGDREPQLVEPRVTLYAIDEAPARGPSVRGATRLAAVVTAWISENGTDLAAVSATGSNDLPISADRAYRAAARRTAVESPGCRLPWTLLAAVGRVESDHGRYGGSVLGLDGRPRPAIIGVALDGVGPVRAVPDSDDGRWDGDRVWDRAVGPMQFIPGTWAPSGRDGDGDGLADPHDLDDAALAAASYLCRAGDLGDSATRSAAILSYNHSAFYVDLVNAYEAGYRTGVFAIPSPTAPR